MTETRQRVIANIIDVCRPEKPDLSDGDKPLLAIGLDSLDFASALMALEDEFSLSLQDVDVEELNTLNKLVAFIDKQKVS